MVNEKFSAPELRIMFYAVESWLETSEDFCNSLHPNDPNRKMALDNLNATRNLHKKLQKIVEPLGYVK